MANAKPSSTAPRAISPKPTTKKVGNGDPAKITPAHDLTVVTVDNGLRSPRGRERDIPGGLQPPQRSDSVNLSPSPTRFRPRPMSTVQPLPSPLPPSVNVEPPQSPPKIKTLNLSLAAPSTYLSADSPVSAGSGRSSPGHFRIPSRPHTPSSDTRRSPALRPMQPPSPPPPRRSGELRRDNSVKTTPPVVNRAEKPKISSKPTNFHLDPGHRIPEEAVSPFGTPPGSNDIPQNGFSPPALPPNRPRMVGNNFVSAAPASTRTFEPPPVHHAVVNRRRDQEANGVRRETITPQITGDQRPALPSRPQGAPEPSSSRTASYMAMPPPPPPRASMDRSRPVVSTDEASYSTPPKRVFSTPTSQVQTPPRSHGRSMTVDRASDRTPAEFRQPLAVPSSRLDPRAPVEATASTYIRETLSQNQAAVYPDFTHSNRRTPYFKQGVREIPTGYETRIHDVCGEFICTTGHVTRVWNSLDGDPIMTLPTADGTKIVSVAFKPAPDVRDEGRCIWLGNNIGEILEVDIDTKTVVTTKTNAHTRREVIRIFRHKADMWTLDDGGTLHLWAADNSGAPNLTNPSTTFRVPKGHTFSMLAVDELWIATGKDIRVFLPSMDGNVQFQVLQRPLSETTAGEVTSGAVIRTQPDLIYFGHVDGKVSVYSRRDYSCLGIYSIGVYKITSLAGVAGRLWAGFSTGMIYVYDTSVTPWAVKKDWLAHTKPIINMISDRSSFWSLDRAQVVSLGQDNILQVWDGMLQADWMGKCLGLG